MPCPKLNAMFFCLGHLGICQLLNPARASEDLHAAPFGRDGMVTTAPSVSPLGAVSQTCWARPEEEEMRSSTTNQWTSILAIVLCGSLFWRIARDLIYMTVTFWKMFVGEGWHTFVSFGSILCTWWRQLSRKQKLIFLMTCMIIGGQMFVRGPRNCSRFRFSTKCRPLKLNKRRHERTRARFRGTRAARTRTNTQKRGDNHHSTRSGGCLVHTCGPNGSSISSYSSLSKSALLPNLRKRSCYLTRQQMDACVNEQQPRGCTEPRAVIWRWRTLACIVGVLLIVGFAIIVWRPYSPFAAVRIGEASRPGPNYDYVDMDGAID